MKVNRKNQLKLLNILQDEIIGCSLMLDEDQKLVSTFPTPNEVHGRSCILPCLYGTSLLGLFAGFKLKNVHVSWISSAPIIINIVARLYEFYYSQRYENSIRKLVQLLKYQYNMHQNVLTYLSNRLLETSTNDNILEHFTKIIHRDKISSTNHIIQHMKDEMKLMQDGMLKFLFAINSTDSYSPITSYDFDMQNTNNDSSMDEVVKLTRVLFQCRMLLSSNFLGALYLCLNKSAWRYPNSFGLIMDIIENLNWQLERTYLECKNLCDRLTGTENGAPPVKQAKPNRHPYFNSLHEILFNLQLSFDIVKSIKLDIDNNAEADLIEVKQKLQAIQKQQFVVDTHLDILTKLNVTALHKADEQPSQPLVEKNVSSTADENRPLRTIRHDDQNAPREDEEFSLYVKADAGDDNEQEQKFMENMNYDKLVKYASAQKLVIAELRTKLEEISGKKRPNQIKENEDSPKQNIVDNSNSTNRNIVDDSKIPACPIPPAAPPLSVPPPPPPVAPLTSTSPGNYDNYPQHDLGQMIAEYARRMGRREEDEDIFTYSNSDDSS